MSWASDRDATLASATSTGTALANLYTQAKTAMTTAQNGSGTSPDVSDMAAWTERVGIAVHDAIVAAGVLPNDLKLLLRFAIKAQWR